MAQYPRLSTQKQPSLPLIEVRQQQIELRRQDLVATIHRPISHQQPPMWEPSTYSSARPKSCGCGIAGDRDIISAILAATVTHTDPDDPATAHIDPNLREHARALVLAGRVNNVPVTGDPAQQEGPVRSTVRHNPTPGTGQDGSPHQRAPAGQGDRPAPPRHRPHRGRRRTRRTSPTHNDP